ncbi:YczE/YyaS/YitT family protein [Levilactobacillus sp. HBUAS67488]|uniref:YczE/YyaS/YitT family protein n=1 Tax=Levilactobacillus sp. HBUAS67488 TaxID=3109361 RepID=UPI001B3B22B7|nr:hypothetical protein [Lactobacillus sp. HBUAS51381]
MTQRWIALFLGLVVNAFGNGLSVASNMGTSPWTASEVNLSHWLGTSVGLAIFVVSCLAAIANQLLLRHWDFPRLLGEVGFVLFFSYFVDIFSTTFTRMGIMRLSAVVRLLLAITGIVIFCAAISMYQRANLVMHPNDDTTNILRFLYCHDNVIVAQLLTFTPPVIIILVCWINTHQLYAVNWGTLFTLLFNGTLIGLADRLVWPGLHHNFRAKPAR